ncbi:transmembrane emp24 domain-containing protein 6-like [Astyanax mexicanus]|uniref:Transmembrane emp24 domain-containing protein 6-like n=2 Tax=Astyanax mexicanus TaxID=7994 RepID=A0A8T2LSW2_ASTMX|nr:transmembrane emp24 domain-containing protein 6-like [Astyanax mexicanus]KAG9272446.1 transmembrane emp24 domain-containing protein 6-like [Astyanax mexicanus]
MNALILLILLILAHQSGSQDTAEDEHRKGQRFLQWADHYDFALKLSGTESQCYWHFARQDGRFYLTYMVLWVSGMIADQHVAVSLFSPKGTLMTFTDDTKGQMNFQVKETGFYQMCFANYHNRFGEMRLFLNFGVYYEEDAEVLRENEMEEKILNSTLSNIKGISNKLRLRIQHMWRFYNVARMRRGADYYLLQSKSNYVYTWSILQSIVIVMSGYLQLFILKRLFRTDSDRPRC